MGDTSQYILLFFIKGKGVERGYSWLRIPIVVHLWIVYKTDEFMYSTLRSSLQVHVPYMHKTTRLKKNLQCPWYWKHICVQIDTGNKQTTIFWKLAEMMLTAFSHSYFRRIVDQKYQDFTNLYPSVLRMWLTIPTLNLNDDTILTAGPYKCFIHIRFQYTCTQFHMYINYHCQNKPKKLGSII